MKNSGIELLPNALSPSLLGPSHWRLPHLPAMPLPQFQLHPAADSQRAQVEDYIRARFAQAHQAQIQYFLPNLISLRCAGNYSAAVGLAAGEGPLFAEQYLDAPVEQLAQERLGLAVERSKIIEIGNLVSTWKGSSLLLFIFIAELMHRLGYEWLMFTATREVQALLARLHYQPWVLAEADPKRLPNAGANWGAYYQHQPQVMLGGLSPAIQLARQNPLYRATVMGLRPSLAQVAAHWLQADGREESGQGEFGQREPCDE